MKGFFFSFVFPSLCFKYSMRRRKTCALTMTCNIIKTIKKQPQSGRKITEKTAIKRQLRHFWSVLFKKMLHCIEIFSLFTQKVWKLLKSCPFLLKYHWKITISRKKERFARCKPLFPYFFFLFMSNPMRFFWENRSTGDVWLTAVIRSAILWL